MEEQSVMRLGVLLTSITFLSIAGCQSICPPRCLCYLLQKPRTIECSNQGIVAFPENISDIVSFTVLFFINPLYLFFSIAI